jgi:hypothetical protein
MEQRIYRGGNVPPEDLAAHLVQHYEPQENLQAQRLGEGASLIVQIARGDVPEERRHAVTVGILRKPDDTVAVTLGQQQWLTEKMATYTAVMALVSILATPWALFGLLWPLTSYVGSATLPGDIWSTIDTYMATRGAELGGSEVLQHPHATPQA